MRHLREHVDRLHPLQPVPAGEQHLAVLRKCRRVARHVHEPRRPGLHQPAAADGSSPCARVHDESHRAACPARSTLAAAAPCGPRRSSRCPRRSHAHWPWRPAPPRAEARSPAPHRQVVPATTRSYPCRSRHRSPAPVCPIDRANLTSCRRFFLLLQVYPWKDADIRRR